MSPYSIISITGRDYLTILGSTLASYKSFPGRIAAGSPATFPTGILVSSSIESPSSMRLNLTFLELAIKVFVNGPPAGQQEVTARRPFFFFSPSRRLSGWHLGFKSRPWISGWACLAQTGHPTLWFYDYHLMGGTVINPVGSERPSMSRVERQCYFAREHMARR